MGEVAAAVVVVDVVVVVVVVGKVVFFLWCLLRTKGRPSWTPEPSPCAARSDGWLAGWCRVTVGEGGDGRQ